MRAASFWVARMAVSRIEYALKDAGAAGRGPSRVVRIGIFTSLASGFLADLLQTYQADNPFVNLDFPEGGRAEHIASVQHHWMNVFFPNSKPSAVLEPCGLRLTTRILSSAFYYLG
jgi:DNA-binding transcriptional LysR family regulator